MNTPAIALALACALAIGTTHAQVQPGAVASAAKPTDADLGDADSFQRASTYLGLATTLRMVITAACPLDDPATEICIVRAPDGNATPFDLPSLASIKLPAKASKSLLCFQLTPRVLTNFENVRATPLVASFVANIKVRIENPMLDDATLINPHTGAPFDGRIETLFNSYADVHMIRPLDIDQKRITFTQGCVNGLVSQRVLRDTYGLTDAQAKHFFTQPMTVTFGAQGNATAVKLVALSFGVRLYGDK